MQKWFGVMYMSPEPCDIAVLVTMSLRISIRGKAVLRSECDALLAERREGKELDFFLSVC